MMGTSLTSLYFYLYESVSQSSFVSPSLFVTIYFLIFYMSYWWQIDTGRIIYLYSRFEHLLYLVIFRMYVRSFVIVYYATSVDYSNCGVRLLSDR
jgi:hypothetical protein